ncbi:MAG: hypothetical protein IVW55_18225 [Chloroflexi bacterium]|nr:hypothetical protein [Chloroflexota bacterium]
MEMRVVELDMPEYGSDVIGVFISRWGESLSLGTTRLRWYDVLSGGIARLRPSYESKLADSAWDRDVELARSYMALDWLVRVCAPAWLELAGLAEHASALRCLDAITNVAAADADNSIRRVFAARRQAYRAAREAYHTYAPGYTYRAGYYAGYYARFPAQGAYGAAYSAYEEGGADHFIAYEAYQAVRHAALASAYKADGKVRAELRPTVEQLQLSARLLLDRMIALE